MESRLSKLQKRSTGARCVALNPTMDLVALLNNDGQLSIHRTISWDRILAKSIELGDDAWGVPTSVTFSPSGNLVALGHARGQISIVNMESGEVTKAYDSSALHTRVTNPSPEGLRSIVKMAWVEAPPHEQDHANAQKGRGIAADAVSLAMVSGIGNIYQGLKASLVNASDISLDTSPQFNLSDSAMPGSVLYAVSADGRITVYVSGIFPIFIFDRRIVEAGKNSGMLASLYTIIPPAPDSSGKPAGLGMEKLLFGSGKWGVNSFLSQHYDEHVVLLLIRAKANAARLNSMLSACAKRWKDANRPLSAKMNLLKSALGGYELNMSPLQFLYSIAQCGLWHPAAVMSFSQHWNEQGLGRLRAAVDSASKSIIQTLHFDVTNCATSVMLQCLELLKVLEVKSRGTLPSSQEVHARLVGHAKGLVHAAEHVLMTVDSAAREARRARDSVTLFIQFVREWHYKAQAQEDSDKDREERPKNAPTPLSPALYIRLFDPRKSRAPAPDPAVHSEFIVGTHLMPYFVDAPLPISTSTSSGSAGRGGGDFTALEQLVHHLAQTRAPHGDVSMEGGSQEDLSNHSLLQAFRYLNERLDTAQAALSTSVTSSADTALKRAATSLSPADEDARTKANVPSFLQSMGYTANYLVEAIFLPCTASDRTTSAASSPLPKEVRFQIIADDGEEVNVAKSSVALYAKPSTDAPSSWELALVCISDRDDTIAYCAVIAPSVVASGECLSLGTARLETRLSFKASAATIDPSEVEAGAAMNDDALSLVCVAEALSSQVRTGTSAKVATDDSAGSAESELLLFKVPLEELQWCSMPTAGVTAAIERQEVECRAGRSLALKTLQAMEVSPEKSVAAALDASGRLVVVDLVEE